MATYTLTTASPLSVAFAHSGGDMEVIVADAADSLGRASAKMVIQIETAAPGTYINIPQTEFTYPTKGTYTFKAGNFKFLLTGGDATTSVTVNVK